VSLVKADVGHPSVHTLVNPVELNLNMPCHNTVPVCQLFLFIMAWTTLQYRQSLHTVHS